jgi:hypothetical protein
LEYLPKIAPLKVVAFFLIILFIALNAFQYLTLLFSPTITNFGSIYTMRPSLYMQYGKLPLCCAPETLLCAFFRAHGKEVLCRVAFPRRKAKKTLVTPFPGFISGFSSVMR